MERTRWYNVLAFMSLFLIGWLDYLTGPELGFSVFYFVPLAFLGWYGNPVMSFIGSLASGLIWYMADLQAGHVYSSIQIGYWNALVRFLSFLMISLTFHRLRRNWDEQVHLNQELELAIAEITQLSGLLPICSTCKKIRDDQGYWRQIEEYISDHSDAEFTHGICPECARLLYPDFSKRVETGE